MDSFAHNYEIASFFGLALFFSLIERLRPARRIDWLADLKIDVFSFALAVVMNRLSRHAVRAFLESVLPAGLLHSLTALQSLPSWLRIALAIVAVDFTIYWIHRAQHRFEFMWRTHQWHHSIEHMYWLAGFRTSFLHSFIYNIPQTVIPMQLFQLSPFEAGIGYSIGLFIQFWEHTNLHVNLGPLRHILITPDYHRIHHSATEHQGMNLGTTFSLWDRMFGTFVDPEKVPDQFPMGLGQPVKGREMPRMLVGV
jgi:sterol desaturase/sphingolipid hydroxylase (fatty acid hydroxylase superfamily)